MITRHMRLLCAALAGIAFAIPAGSPAEAQRAVNAYSPALANSGQRRAILDALRPAVETRLGTGVEFMVERIRVQDGWALVHADPRRRDGRRIDGRRIFANFDDMDGLTVTALLRFQGGRWNLVQHSIGATDVWYCTPRIRAPRALTNC